MTSDPDPIVVGGRPAGVMTGLLFARAGCTVRVLDPGRGCCRQYACRATRRRRGCRFRPARRPRQDNVIGRLLEPGEPIRRAPLAVRLLDRFPLLRRIPGRIVGLGVRRERVRSPPAARRP